MSSEKLLASSLIRDTMVYYKELGIEVRRITTPLAVQSWCLEV
jgi:hypothetical protein